MSDLLDVVVVGAGPAGLATAIAARLEGLAVAVLDSRRPPLDKACGEGLMPDGVARLEALGVFLPAAGTAPLRGVRYLDGPWVAEARFPGKGGLGVRRPILHEALARRALELGAELRWGEVARRLAGGEGVETDRGRLRGRWVVAADGLHSALRRRAGLARPASGPPGRFGVRRHYGVEPWSDCVEVYWSAGCEAYVTPVASGEVGVALLAAGERLRFDELLRRFPALSERLAGRPASSRDLGAGPFRQEVRGVARGRLALVGDAAGYLDALTGEGLADALHQAVALAAALREGDLRAYRRAHRRLMRLPTLLTRGLLVAERRPWLRRRLVRALARDATLFSRLLALHARQHGAAVGPVLRLAAGLARG